jgi:hypothetical protein
MRLAAALLALATGCGVAVPSGGTAPFAGASTSAAARGRLAVHPDGRFLCVARQDAPEIVAIPTDGAALGPPRKVAALHAAWVAVAPSR